MSFGMNLNQMKASLVTTNWQAVSQTIQYQTQNAITQTKLENEQIQQQKEVANILQQLKDTEADHTQQQYHDQAWGSWGAAIGMGVGMGAGLCTGLSAGADENPARPEEEDITISGRKPAGVEEDDIELQPLNKEASVKENEMVGAEANNRPEAEDAPAVQEKASGKASAKKAEQADGEKTEAEKAKEARDAEKEKAEKRSHAYNMGMQTQQLVSQLAQNVSNGCGQYYAGNEAQSVLQTQGLETQGQTAQQMSDKNYQTESSSQASFEKARDAEIQVLSTLISLSRAA